MDWYILLKFLHVLAVILWLGGAFSLMLSAAFAERANDDARLLQVADNSAMLGKLVFMPAILVLLVSGAIMWWMRFGLFEFWLILGLGGFVVSMLMGMLIMGPGSERIANRIAEEGVSAEVVNEARRLIRLGRFELTVLFAVVAVMVFRPVPGDIGILAALALVIIAGAVLFLSPGRKASPA